MWNVYYWKIRFISQILNIFLDNYFLGDMCRPCSSAVVSSHIPIIVSAFKFHLSKTVFKSAPWYIWLACELVRSIHLNKEYIYLNGKFSSHQFWHCQVTVNFLIDTSLLKRLLSFISNYLQKQAVSGNSNRQRTGDFFSLNQQGGQGCHNISRSSHAGKVLQQFKPTS